MIPQLKRNVKADVWLNSTLILWAKSEECSDSRRTCMLLELDTTLLTLRWPHHHWRLCVSTFNWIRFWHPMSPFSTLTSSLALPTLTVRWHHHHWHLCDSTFNSIRFWHPMSPFSTLTSSLALPTLAWSYFYIFSKVLPFVKGICGAFLGWFSFSGNI